MKKIGIITINDNNNYGNRLQNYALYYYCKNTLNTEVYNLENNAYLNNKKSFIINYLKYKRRLAINWINRKLKKMQYERYRKFIEFNRNIKQHNKKINAFSNINRFDYIIVGSDQVWNPKIGGLKDVDTLKYVEDNKKISYAASFGIETLEEKHKSIVNKQISKFKSISVREDSGKKMIEKLTKRRDVEINIDPTMLLTSDEWDKVSKRPKQLEKLKNEKYILNYFLGNLSERRRKEIERIADENNCHIINILDKEDSFYSTGPSEFLYLEKNAFLICTDSYHSSVFALIYNRPVVIFEREEISKIGNMNSRLDTLIRHFKLENRKYNGMNITRKNIEHDYTDAYLILEKEREKSKIFLKKALDIK